MVVSLLNVSLWLFLCLLCIVVLWILRLKIPTSVTCWFCGKVSKVKWRNRNSWFCPSCEQYNGFNKDGDYNRDIPSMYNERLNKSSVALQPRVAQKPDVTNVSSANGLCRRCSQNLVLKEKFDEEIEQYQKRLEEIYSLCPQCQCYVQNEIAQQNQKLGLTAMLGRWWRKSSSRVNGVAGYDIVSLDGSVKCVKAANSCGKRKMTWLSASLKLLAVDASILIWLINVQNLQMDSKTDVIDLSYFLSPTLLGWLNYLYSSTYLLCAIGLVAQFGGFFMVKRRRFLVDYVTVLLWAFMLALHLVNGDNSSFLPREDLFTFQMAAATVVATMSVWILILPRKRLTRLVNHGKRSPGSGSRSGSSCRSSPASVGSYNAYDGASVRSFKAASAFSPRSPGSEASFLTGTGTRSNANNSFDATHHRLSELSISTNGKKLFDYFDSPTYANAPSLKLMSPNMFSPKLNFAGSSPRCDNAFFTNGIYSFNRPFGYSLNSKSVLPSPGHPCCDSELMKTSPCVSTRRRTISAVSSESRNSSKVASHTAFHNTFTFNFTVCILLIFSLLTNILVLYCLKFSIGDGIKQLIDRRDGLYCFRLHKDRVYYAREDVMKLAAVIGREHLRSFGTCLGKFTKGKQFFLHITSLVYLAPYARYKIWLRPNAEQQFLYGHHVLKSGIARMADDCPRNVGALVLSQSDIPLGFGVTAKSTAESRKADPTAIVLYNQADIGQYIRNEKELM